MPSAAAFEEPLAAAAEWVAAAVPEAAAELERGGLPAWLAPLLARRGVTDLDAARRFLNPSLDQLHDPGRLHGMAAAVARLVAARDRGERVAVIGDYDVDGVTATALLVAVLGACRIDAHPILPHRLREGYGFQPVHVERAAELGCRVVVTVDCGVGSAAAVAAAAAAGLDVVITDHHLPGEALPPGTVLVNPRQELCDYPFAGLAGVGLALKLALAVARACGRDLDPRQLLRIACLGTIADLVPLVDENRVIAALGLEALGATTSEGLRALFRCAGVEPPLSAADVGFRLGPRLNAAGRLDDAHGALELLVSRDPERCRELAERLDRLNRDRQGEEQRVVDEARRLLAARRPLPALAVAWSQGWHRGVLGIAAGRLARELHRPTLLLALDGDGATGSGRSIPGVGLHDFLAAWRGDFARFGGHDQAVGLSVELAEEPGRLERLRGAWEAAAGAWPPELLVRRHEYELALAPRRVTLRMLRNLARLEPHGMGNPQPLARVGPLVLAAPPRRFGKESRHLSAVAAGEDGGRVGLLGWRWGERAAELAGRFEVLGHLEVDRYRNAPTVRLLDVRPL
jgi:single-stranded-DNA-specific exonuclease